MTNYNQCRKHLRALLRSFQWRMEQWKRVFGFKEKICFGFYMNQRNDGFRVKVCILLPLSAWTTQSITKPIAALLPAASISTSSSSTDNHTSEKFTPQLRSFKFSSSKLRIRNNNKLENNTIVIFFPPSLLQFETVK